MLRIILKTLGMISLWAVVVVIVIWIEPETIKDILVPGFYLPMWAAISLALSYSMTWIMGFSKYSVLISLILSIFVALLLRF